MSLKNFGEVDLCGDCIHAVTYGGADFTTVTDNLGVAVAFFDSTDDEDGHFCDCDGCKAQRLTVYTGNVLTEDDF
jgi:hypothetical protein